jgi:ankyrin repeat protein
MSAALPERASLEFLRKLAKERLRDLRLTNPSARLADAQLALAREYGFPSWRALKAEVDRRQAPARAAFASACRNGDLPALEILLRQDPSLVHVRLDHGATGLHLAVRHPQVVQMLLQLGADPDVREEGDNALPLHFAAGAGHIDSVRALLDAGSDVQGVGDAHRMDTIGWATVFEAARRDVVELLVQRGAKHHVFSAIAFGDTALLRRVVTENPDALARRLSVHEQEQTALHYVVAPADGLVGGLFRTGEHYALLDTLIELGADLEARDSRGRTALDLAMLRGDEQAMRRLHTAGARSPAFPAEPELDPAELARSVSSLAPMLAVPDIAATVAWYRALGFALTGSHGEDGDLDFAELSLGRAAIMFVPSGGARPAGETTDIPEVRFSADLYTAFYGQREFGIRDPNGVELMFFQPLDPPGA